MCYDKGDICMQMIDLGSQKTWQMFLIILVSFLFFLFGGVNGRLWKQSGEY